MICPKCKGSGRTGPCFVNRGSGPHTIETLTCFTCKGTKEITDEHNQRIELGKRVRADRLSRNVSQREEAVRLGLKFMDYTNLEQGREMETDIGREVLERRKGELEAA